MNIEADYLGIDPGLSGGWAVVSGDKIRCKQVMPTLSFTSRDGKTKTEIDREGVLSFLGTLSPHTHVAIEEQRPFRKQDIAATCTQCKNYGILLMALFATHMHVTEIASDIWQAHFGIVSVKESGGKTTKQQARSITERLYPHADLRKSGRAQLAHEGIVDAALIARYCQDTFAPFQKPDVQFVSTVDETSHEEGLI